MRFFAACAVVPLLLVGWQLWNDRSFEHRLQPIASGIAGHEIHVDCQSFLGALLDAQGREGEVRFDADGKPESKLFLTRSTCQQLRSFAKHTRHHELDCLSSLDWTAVDPLPFESSCYRRASKTIYAVLVLAHESYHTVGVTDEAATNCYAIQAMAWVATSLGAPASEAELLARAMEVLEPKQTSGYDTPDCHADRRLDLHPGTPAFPTERPIGPPPGQGGLT